MKKSKKLSIIAAIALIIAGLLISFAVLLAIGFDFERLNTVDFEEKTYTVEEGFANISVDCAECDVRLVRSEDEVCRVVCPESEKIFHSVKVNNNTLTVERTDNRKWYECINFYWGKTERITVYLPQSKYDELYIKSVSGDIEIPKSFSFADAEIKSTSGDVSLLAAVENDVFVKTVSGEVHIGGIISKSLDVKTTSGDVAVGSAVLEERLNVKTVSGNIELSDIECNSLETESTSGDMNFSDAYAAENMHIKSVSGDVSLTGCDSDTLWIKTTSGDVSGSLLTEKTFVTDTESGDVDVPNSVGGKCEVKTTSGDIEFTIPSVQD